MALIYGEGKFKASRRLEEEIHKSYKGIEFNRFAVGLDLLSIPEASQFVARERELGEIHRLLHGHNARSTVILHGLGGIGKTQLAVEYTRRHKEKYTAIFWLNANDEDSLMLTFRDIAQQLLKHHPSTDMLASVDLEGNLDQVVNGVKAWLNLRDNTRWLIIYDNYDNPRTPGNPDSSALDIRQFLPSSDHGSIIITTRSSQVSQYQRIHVQKLQNIQESLQILANMSGRKDVENDSAALELVKELDGLPLALSTAGAYLAQVTTSFSEYLRLHKASWMKLQTTSPQLSSYEGRSLYTTWQITLDRIQQQSVASAKMLKLWAYFDRQDIWFELLRHGTSTGEEWIQSLAEDELSFNKAIRLLCEYGLVDRDSLLRGYSVHSCVHSWAVFVLNKEWDENLARVALTCVASEIPSTNIDNWWLLQRRLLQHATWQQHFILDGRVDNEGMSWALHNLGHLYRDQGRLAEAEAMYSRALQGYKEALGSRHPSTLNTANNLGSLYIDQGRLVEAEVMLNEALQGYEEAFGPKHTSTFNIINNLGSLYSNQGRLAEAEVMFNQALQGKEEALGPKHISTLNTVNNLGSLYIYQGELAKAEAIYSRALQGKKEALGPTHISTLFTIENLGSLYIREGRLAEAEVMYNQALQGYEEALGPKHISTINTINSLGLLYAKQGRLTEAEVMYSQALQGYEEALGLTSVSSYMPALNPVFNLGDLYSETSQTDKAMALYTRALTRYTAIREASPDVCEELEDRLRALQLGAAKLETHRDASTEIRAPRLTSLMRQIFRKDKR